jgi:hypothetical protein
MCAFRSVAKPCTSDQAASTADLSSASSLRYLGQQRIGAVSGLQQARVIGVVEVRTEHDLEMRPVFGRETHIADAQFDDSAPRTAVKSSASRSKPSVANAVSKPALSPK